MIYLDNAATTFPKPNTVVLETLECIKSYCANPGRSSHSLSIRTAEKIFDTREKIAEFLGVLDKSDRVSFTLNASYALNLAIKSTLKKGEHVLISDIEHNSVVRPVYSLYKAGIIEYGVFDSDAPEKSIKENLRQNTSCIISTLSSNVTGKKIDLGALSRIAKESGVRLIVDASQLIGHEKIDLSKTPCDVLCAPGHKALFGIQGAGFIVFNDNVLRDTVIEGGSGNNSLSLEMPIALPERFEAGTLPSPAIISILRGIEFIENVGLTNIGAHIKRLTDAMYERLKTLPSLKIYGCGNGVLSFNLGKVPSEELALLLNNDGICTRAGLHCAPSVHKKLGTLETGAVRASVSYFNTMDEVDSLYKSLKAILRVC